MNYDYEDLVTSLLMALSQSAIASLPEEQKKAAHAVVHRHIDEALKDPEFNRVIRHQIDNMAATITRQVLEERKKALYDAANKAVSRQSDGIVEKVVKDVTTWLQDELRRKLRFGY